MAKIQIIGGGFQDSEGNALASGYLTMELSQDCEVTATGQVCSGILITVPLDGSGNVSGTVNIWPNDQLSPANNYYTVTGYSVTGQKVWGPNIQQVTGAGPFNLDSWIPNQITNWVPTPATLSLQTNEVANGSQTLLDLHAGTGITLADNGSGRVTIANSEVALTLQTDGTPNGSQTLLDLQAGSNVSLTDNGSGQITIAASAPTVYAGSNWGFGRAVAANSFHGLGTGITTSGAGSGSSAFNPATATEPAQWSLTSSQFGSGYYQSIFDGFKLVSSGLLADYQFRVQVLNSTGCWLWLGLVDTTSLGSPSQSSIFNTSNVNQNFIGFRYSTAAGDTHWQAYCSQSSSAFTVANTGVSVDTTASHFFEIKQVTSGTMLFLIDGTQVASISTNVPSGSTTLGLVLTAMQNGLASTNLTVALSECAYSLSK